MVYNAWIYCLRFNMWNVTTVPVDKIKHYPAQTKYFTFTNELLNYSVDKVLQYKIIQTIMYMS